MSLLAMATTVFSFFIYFLPESQFTRISGIIPFFSLTLSYCLLIIYKGLVNVYVPIKRFVTPLYVLLALVIMVPNVSQPMSGLVSRLSVDGKDLSAIQPYEYEAAIWIKENTPRDTIILSDPYSTIIIRGLTARYAFIGVGWLVEQEYRREDRDRMLEMKQNFFLANSSRDAHSYAIRIRSLLSDNYSLSNLYYQGNVDPQGFTVIRRTNPNATILVVFSWRTSSWLTQDKMFITSWTSPLYYTINPLHIRNFFDPKYFDLVYNNTYIYIFRVKD
jgi:hypothetical protein